MKSLRENFNFVYKRTPSIPSFLCRPFTSAFDMCPLFLKQNMFQTTWDHIEETKRTSNFFGMSVKLGGEGVRPFADMSKKSRCSTCDALPYFKRKCWPLYFGCLLCYPDLYQILFICHDPDPDPDPQHND